ncbi:MAG TPA: TonB-dependent receptor [Brevundimonas sp.]|jgi:iron complex outermembrane receptor protein|uniref:TonB-dependent receptor domain-containing protein n=1 Tax=Brevundimonas sp. TaxID=1871086 RepID=UPI002E11A899|nr:TonB-dependent receptor [Brevundimonas sp.]
MCLRSILTGAAALALLAAAGPAVAQSGPRSPAQGPDADPVTVDVLVVTGSRLAGAGRLTPVEVIGREALGTLGGDASVLLTRLTANSGSEARVDQLNAPQSSGVAQVNLRNLGLGATLVLVDGQRWTTSAAIAPDGSAFVDLNSLVPTIALERVEVLKDGASAVYGSDAVAGVMNLITRREVTRPELQVGHAAGRGFGETTVQGLAGLRWRDVTATVAAAHFHRSALSTDERDFPQAERYGRAGWTAVTSYGQPGSYFRPSTGGFAPDPACGDPTFTKAFRNSATDVFCRLDYSDFFDLAPEETRTQVFAEVRAPLGGLEVWGQVAASDTFTRIRQSPSLPILARALTVPATHPDNPFGETVTFRGRLLGAEAGASTADFAYETWRLAGGVSGEAAGWRWSAAATVSRQHVAYDKPDVIGSAVQAALNGLGGAGCDPAAGTPGVGPCRWFNPFGSATLGTGTANAPELIDSLIGSTGLRGAAGLSTIEIEADRRLAEGNRGTLDLALGVEARESRFRHDWSDLVNAGELLTAGQSPDFEGRLRAAAVFAEARARLGDAWELQLAARHERQGDQDALSPKVAARWDLAPGLALRGAWGRAFRAPSVFVTDGAQAAQPSVFDRGAFVFVNTLTTGNPDLKPERSEHLSLGAVWAPGGGLTVTLDGWRFETTDLVVKESAQAVIDQAARDTAAGLTGTAAQGQVSRGPGGTLTGVRLGFLNASAVTAQGWDLAAGWGRAAWGGTVSADLRWTYIDRHDIRLSPGAPAVSAVGSTNLNTLARSMPRNQGRLALGWRGAGQTVSLTARYTHGYRNDRAGITRTDIASQTTFDFAYGAALGEGLDLRLEAINLTDRDPPLVQFAFAYDPVVADPRGRLVSLTVTQRF